jgi:hypothetical protein
MSPSPRYRATHAAFAQARALEPTDAEVARVLARLPARTPRRAGGRRLVALVVAGALIAAGAASAATGLFGIGTELPPLDRVIGPGEPTYLSGRVVVGTGELPGAGRWQMSATQSDQGRCLAFERPDSLDPAAQEVCGLPSFDAITLGGGSELPRTTVVFGPAPERASAVRVTAPGGFRRTATTHEGTDDMEGDFYVVEIPRRGLVNAEIIWLDEGGRAPHAGMYVPSTVTYSSPSTEPQPPH